MAKEKSLQQRVMEAGFGAMLERHGFEKISATAYQKQHGKLIWKSVMGPGYDWADHGKAWSFRDGTGYTLEGLNELLDAYGEAMGERRHTFGLAGTRHRVATPGGIIAYSSSAYNEEHVPQPLRPAFLIERLLGIKPPRNNHDQFAEDYPQSRSTRVGMNKSESDNYWDLHPYDNIEKFTESVCGLWEKYVLPTILTVETNLDKGQLVKLRADDANELYNPQIIKAYAAGQHADVAQALNTLHQSGRRARDDAIAELEQSGGLSKRYLKNVQATREDMIEATLSGFTYHRDSWVCLKDLLTDPTE